MLKYIASKLSFKKSNNSKPHNCKQCLAYAENMRTIQIRLKATEAQLAEVLNLMKSYFEIHGVPNAPPPPQHQIEGNASDGETEAPSDPFDDQSCQCHEEVKPYVFPDPTAVDLNYWRRNSVSPFCPRCYEEFSCPDSRRMHYRKAHFNVYYSERKYDRASWMPLFRFMSQSFGDLDDERVCTYGCGESVRYSSRIELAEHMEKEHLNTLQKLSVAFFELLEEFHDTEPHAQTSDHIEMHAIMARVRPQASDR